MSVLAGECAGACAEAVPLTAWICGLVLPRASTPHVELRRNGGKVLVAKHQLKVASVDLELSNDER